MTLVESVREPSRLFTEDSTLQSGALGAFAHDTRLSVLVQAVHWSRAAEEDSLPVLKRDRGAVGQIFAASGGIYGDRDFDSRRHGFLRELANRQCLWAAAFDPPDGYLLARVLHIQMEPS